MADDVHERVWAWMTGASGDLSDADLAALRAEADRLHAAALAEAVGREQARREAAAVNPSRTPAEAAASMGEELPF